MNANRKQLIVGSLGMALVSGGVVLRFLSVLPDTRLKFARMGWNISPEVVLGEIALIALIALSSGAVLILAAIVGWMVTGKDKNVTERPNPEGSLAGNACAMKRTNIILAAGLLIVLISCGVWLVLPFQKIQTLDTRYRRVRQGMSTNEVAMIMDHPSTWQVSEPKAWWDDTRLRAGDDARVQSAVRYSVSTFFLPVSFEFTFDADGKVVGRHRYD